MVVLIVKGFSCCLASKRMKGFSLWLLVLPPLISALGPEITSCPDQSISVESNGAVIDLALYTSKGGDQPVTVSASKELYDCRDAKTLRTIEVSFIDRSGNEALCYPDITVQNTVRKKN